MENFQKNNVKEKD